MEGFRSFERVFISGISIWSMCWMWRQQVGNLRLIVLSISYERMRSHARVPTLAFTRARTELALKAPKRNFATFNMKRNWNSRMATAKQSYEYLGIFFSKYFCNFSMIISINWYWCPYLYFTNLLLGMLGYNSEKLFISSCCSQASTCHVHRSWNSLCS